VKRDPVIDDLLRHDHVILLREHPELEDALVRRAAGGRLARVLPGVYVDPGRARDPLTRMVAVTRWDPDAVICGRAAAWLTYWPRIELGPDLVVASKVRHRPQAGFTFRQCRIPTELVQRRGPVSVTAPSLTAIELATLEFTDPIDYALSSKQVTLETLHTALQLTRKRRGNADRWRVLLDSRAEPWSRAERLTHRLYRGAGITSWKANRKIVIPEAGTYFLDIAFDRERVVSEIDGREHHIAADVFEADRSRQNALVLGGWLVLRFTWLMITSDPDYVVRTTQRALEQRRRQRVLR
jgi:very-short-patch-repair endonuclease